MSAIKCKFEKVYLRNEADTILKEYNELNSLLSLKKKSDILKKNEYEQIFQYDISNIINIECKIEKENNFFYIYFQYFINDDRKVKIIHLSQEPYLFEFNGKKYICFEKITLSDFLLKESEKKKFVITQTQLDDITFTSILDFIDLNIFNFVIKYDYRKREMTQDKLKLENIYSKKNKYNAEDINFNFPYYINIEETDFKNFEYYEPEIRKNFIKEILRYIDYHYYIAICGPFGSGKTVTLLKLITDEARRFFYINLWTVSKTNIDELKEIFNYECIKLFRKNILEINALKELTPEQENMKEIFNCINNFKDKEEIFELILNIISLLKNMEGNYVIVIDQYSSKYDNDNINILNIISNIQNSRVKLLICSSMNNDDVKNNLSKSFSFNNQPNFLTYIYVGVLIQLNIYKIKDESLSFQKLIYELGNLYLYYYLLKENERNNNNLDVFLINEKNSIQKEIEMFYRLKNEFIDRNKMIKDIIDIIYYINEKKIFFYEDLENLILKLPLKFLEIKKQDISVYNLKNYASRIKNIDLQKKIEKYSKGQIESTYTISSKKTSFFKCENIIPKSYKIKLNYLDYKDKLKDNYRFNIYFLDYLFPFMQDIFTNIIYNETMKFGKLFFSNFDGQLEGGFLEYFILEYIKDKKQFFDYNINDFESIETIVENSYFIQNHSSRKPETKRNYEENVTFVNKSIKNTKKIKLRKNVILISQKQFTGKYYDCAFLFPLTKDENDNRFKIASCQISKKKIASQRYYKEEHELILGNVKKNIENNFDIEICEGYFFYIFSSQELDKTSIEFCKKYDFEYVLFSPGDMKFNSDKIFNLEHSLITKNFPIQNSFSILPQEKFKVNKDNTLVYYNEIKSFQKSLKNIKLSEDNETKLNNCLGINEYIFLGFFKEKFKVSKYGFWYDITNKEISYKNSSKEKILSEELIFKNNETDKKFVLIGIKNEIYYNSYHTISEYFKTNNNK